MNREHLSIAPSNAALGLLLGLVFCGAGCNPVPPQTAEPMELQGTWIGMRLSAVESNTALALGIPPSVKGVVVVDLRDGTDSRAIQAGLQRGDVIVAVNGTSITNLTDLYTLTTKLNPGEPLSVEILRQGQSMIATLSPRVQPPGGMVAMQGVPPGAPAMASAPSAAPIPIAAAPNGSQGGPAHLYCPIDQMHWSPNQVGPDFRCPRCGGPLTR